MKISQYLGLSLLALAIWLPARAQAVVATASGHLILGFRTQDATGNGYNLEVDLGAYTQFSNLAAGAVLNLNLGGIYGANGGLSATDLSTVYGSAWNSLSTLAWSVAGTDEDVTLLATFSAGVLPLRKGTGQQQQTSGKLNTVRSTLNGQPNTYVNGASTVNLASNTASALSTSNGGSYSAQIRGGNQTTDYSYFANSTEALVTNSGSSLLNLFQLNTGSGPGTQLGTFALGSNGNFTFTAAPEPTSVVLLGAGAVGWMLRRRRVTA